MKCWRQIDFVNVEVENWNVRSFSPSFWLSCYKHRNMTHLHSQVCTSTTILRSVYSQSGSKAKPNTTQELKECLKLNSNTLGFELVSKVWLMFNMLIVAILCAGLHFSDTVYSWLTTKSCRKHCHENVPPPLGKEHHGSSLINSCIVAKAMCVNAL